MASIWRAVHPLAMRRDATVRAFVSPCVVRKPRRGASIRRITFVSHGCFRHTLPSLCPRLPPPAACCGSGAVTKQYEQCTVAPRATSFCSPCPRSWRWLVAALMVTVSLRRPARPREAAQAARRREVLRPVALRRALAAPGMPRVAQSRRVAAASTLPATAGQRGGVKAAPEGKGLAAAPRVPVGAFPSPGRLARRVAAAAARAEAAPAAAEQRVRPPAKSATASTMIATLRSTSGAARARAADSP